MNDFTFENGTKIYFGRDQLCHLGEELKAYGSKVLLTYGGGSIKRNGIYDAVAGEIKGAGLTLFELSGIEPNPRHTTVNRGAELCKREGIEVLLAVGGGSTIDCTKAIAAAAFYEGDSWDLVIGKAPVIRALPVCSVLTLAATGSEMDFFGVISNLETNDKIGLGHPLLQPKVSFLNPEFTYSVNKFQTACGSADIMAHVFDCYYFTTQKKMAMLDGVMENLLRTVVRFAPVALKTPDDYEARANLMWASSWALNRFLETGVRMQTTCHSIEHELSAYYDITHGLGLAILMPRWLAYVAEKFPETQYEIEKFGVNVLGTEAGLPLREGALAAVDALSRFLFGTLGLQSTLTELGIGEENFSVMAKKACRGDVLHGFVDLTPADVEAILRACL